MNNMKCRICHSSSSHIYIVREMLFGFRDSFKYFQCSNCGCLQICEYPKSLDKYYPSYYYSFTYGSLKSLKARFKSLFLRKRDAYYLYGKGFTGRILSVLFPNDIIRIIGKLDIPFTKDIKILDIGCGNGSLLNRLALQGFNVLHGVDPYIDGNLEYKNGVKVFKKQIGDIEDRYDLVMLHHSLEHMPDQHDVFHNISRILNRDGICLIRIPIVNYAFERFKENWVQIDAPRHFYLHTRTSIEILANEVNLRTANVIYDSTAIQLYGSIKYLNNVPLVEKYRFSMKEMKQFHKEAKSLNKLLLGDSAAFIFRKKALAEDNVVINT